MSSGDHALISAELLAEISTTGLSSMVLVARDALGAVLLGKLLTDRLTCPFCRRRGPARDFLSLAPPSRPARVFVRMRIP